MVEGCAVATLAAPTVEAICGFAVLYFCQSRIFFNYFDNRNGKLMLYSRTQMMAPLCHTHCTTATSTAAIYSILHYSWVTKPDYQQNLEHLHATCKYVVCEFDFKLM